MNIKRITCILLTLVMVLALTACGSSSNNSFTTARTTKNPIDIDVLADAERANLPEVTEDYALVLEETKASKVQIDKYLTKQIAAYENFKDEEACKYIYELNQENDDYMTSLHTAINTSAALLRLDGTDEARAQADRLMDFNLTLSAILATWAEWDMNYNAAKMGVGDAPSYDELMEAAAYVINQTSNLMYSKDMVH